MEHLWAPWRMKYIKETVESGSEECVLCQKPKEKEDLKNLIVCRGEHNYIMLNAYPYNSGHLMVVPYEHVSRLEELAPEARAEHIELIAKAMAALREAYNPDGFNTGMNIGRVSGAGIDKHIHSHVVPRWSGDCNFMPIVCNTKVVNEALEETCANLVKFFKKSY